LEEQETSLIRIGKDVIVSKYKRVPEWKF